MKIKILFEAIGSADTIADVRNNFCENYPEFSENMEEEDYRFDEKTGEFKLLWSGDFNAGDLDKDDVDTLIRLTHHAEGLYEDTDAEYVHVEICVDDEWHGRDQQEQAPTMDVLLVKPSMYPQSVQIGCELEDLQKAVGGDIQAVYPYDDPVALIMDEEAKMMGKVLNRALRDEDGDIYDIIAGDFLVVGLGKENFCSLPSELMKKYEEYFHQPEMFVRMGRSILALPLPENQIKK